MVADMQACLSDYTLLELEARVVHWGFLAVHARRLLRRYYDGCGEVPLEEMGLPKAMQRRLVAELPLMCTRVAKSECSADQTRKLLVEMRDGQRVESVLMNDYRPDRAAGCLSTQVGCAMGCDFCATGMQGFSRNLSAGEIVEQFLHLKSAAAAVGRRLSTIVLMGMGEPLLNLQNVAKAIRLMAEDATGHLGWRQITLSTVGLIPQLRQFVDLRLNVQLAISLHAPGDALRQKLIPVAVAHPIADILALAGQHQENTGRTAIVQYCLFDGVNDTDAHAHALGRLMAGRRMHLNLLMYNPTGQPYRTSSPERLDAFISILRHHRIVAHARRSRGEDIAAACGQLRASHGRDARISVRESDP